MKFYVSLTFVGLFLAFVSCDDTTNGNSASTPELKTKMDTISYVVGYSTGDGLSRQGLEEIDLTIVNGALNEALDGDEAKIDIQQASGMIRQYIMEKQQKKAEENEVAAQKFLEQNAKKKGVETTESGLQYKVLEEGDGPTPQDGDQVEIHYHGTLQDGTVFDSSVDKGQPITNDVGRFVKGFTEGLKMMPEGSKYKFFIPPALGYGQRAMPNIEANSALIFEVELLAINPEGHEGHDH